MLKERVKGFLFALGPLLSLGSLKNAGEQILKWHLTWTTVRSLQRHRSCLAFMRIKDFKRLISSAVSILQMNGEIRNNRLYFYLLGQPRDNLFSTTVPTNVNVSGVHKDLIHFFQFIIQ